MKSCAAWLGLAVGVLGCGGAMPDAAPVGARAADVQVVDVGAAKPAPAPAPSSEPAPPPGKEAAAAEDDAARESARIAGILGEMSAGAKGGGLGFGSGPGPGVPSGSIGISGFGVAPSGSKVPQLRAGATNVVGALPPEVIQRIVRSHFGQFRACYERGLVKNAKLAGKVRVRFVIDKTGSVSNAADQASVLPDAAVVACIVRSFSSLSFPQPDGGGIVVVTYPLDFAPGDSAPPAPTPQPAKPAP